MVKLSDVLQHYGVKGMKWEDHQYAEEEQVANIAKQFNLTTEQAKQVKTLAEQIDAQRQANPTANLSEAQGKIKDAPGSNDGQQSTDPNQSTTDPNKDNTDAVTKAAEEATKAVEEAKAAATKAVEEAKAAATKAIEDIKASATKDVEAAKLALNRAFEEARVAKEKLAELEAKAKTSTSNSESTSSKEQSTSTAKKKATSTSKKQQSAPAKKSQSTKKKTSTKPAKKKVDNSDKPEKEPVKKKSTKKDSKEKPKKKKSGKKGPSWGKRLALAIKKKLGMKTKAQLKKEREKKKHKKKKKKKTELEHSGVKGMRWGVRHDEHRVLNPKESKKVGKLKKHLSSLKRERQWGNAIKDVHNLSTKDIKLITARVNLENSLKVLTKTKLATKKDKEDYLNRHEMSNEELSRKIARLQAKDNLHQAVKKASKEQREVGIKVAQTAGSLGVNYVLNGGRPTGSFKTIAKATAKDAMTIWEKPKENWDKAESDVLNEIERRNQFAGQVSKFVTKQYKSKKAKENKK